MDFHALEREDQAAVDDVLGYLNFSSGASDAGFQGKLNDLFGRLEQSRAERPWAATAPLLAQRLDALGRESPAFANVQQAAAVIDLALVQLPKAYRAHHHDLLFHQSDEQLFRPFLLARACEAVLAEGAPWSDADRIVAGAIHRLNDFIGYRPVAVLRTPQRVEPYEHEWVRPIPLYLRGVGAAQGRYQPIIEAAVAVLQQTDADVLRDAWFDLELLDELALDPRAYDFDHPVNKRPNYHFGCWDPHQLDQQGRYRRFVLQQVTLDALIERIEKSNALPCEEVLFEAGAVLAGTILMASGTSGDRPEAHDSEVSLATLLPRIAQYRDAFYERLLARLEGPRAERLRAEAVERRQPFGAARQDLNGRLARLRAKQLQHVHLAQIFARMGAPQASARQARIVPVASARMLCEIDSRLTTAHRELDSGRRESAALLCGEVEDLLERGIQCGALVDPWNILGFQGNFSLHVNIQDSVRDHRVLVLIEIVEQIFGLQARLQSEAAAVGDAPLRERVAEAMHRRATWWDQFAAVEVTELRAVFGREAVESAARVAEALGAWHAAGEAAGDIGFWSRHVADFHSPKAYGLVVATLIEKQDYVASMALIMQWLSRADEASFGHGDRSLPALAERWLTSWWRRPLADDETLTDRWATARKFFDYLEANADDLWQVPRFQWAPADEADEFDDLESYFDDEDDLDEDDEDDDDGLFSAAYEEVTFRDSTDDGFEGEMLESGVEGDFELDDEAERLRMHLHFLRTVAELWRAAALEPLASDPQAAEALAREEVLRAWFGQVARNRRELLRLLNDVHHYELPEPLPGAESLVEYDRRRIVREMLLADVIDAYTAASDAARVLLAVGGFEPAEDQLEDLQASASRLMASLVRGDVEVARARFDELLERLDRQPVLYVPLDKGGDPRRVAQARDVYRLVAQLLEALPRLGMLRETRRLLETTQAMERHRPQGGGVVTEFDRLFEVAYRAVVECLIASVGGDDQSAAADDEASEAALIEGLKFITEPLLKRWLAHSRKLRLSVLEAVGDQGPWEALVEFIRRYGRDLLTQRFLNIGNLRAILHQGVDRWLENLQAQAADEDSFALIADLDGGLDRDEAAGKLALILEAVVENYGVYRDYNTTTTQSDQGELLYLLLDFLRLKASYQRFAWNLKPVVTAHEVLVRRGRVGAAELWRRALLENTAEVADWHLQKLNELRQAHGMRISTVGDRIEERFVRLLAVDRLRALVRPAIEEVRGGAPAKFFPLLEQEIEEFTSTPSGAGLDAPPWLESLEEEVEQTLASLADSPPGADLSDHGGLPLPRVRLTLDEIQAQFTDP